MVRESPEIILAEIYSVLGLANWQPGVADVEGVFFSPLLILDERKKMFNFRVNETLVPHNPSYIWNIDEKPLLPDLVKGSFFSAAGIHLPPSAGNRSASWTILFWNSAAGRDKSGEEGSIGLSIGARSSSAKSIGLSMQGLCSSGDERITSDPRSGRGDSGRGRESERKEKLP